MKNADGERMAPQHFRRIRFCLGVFIAGLALSGVTAFPLVTETRWLDAAMHTPLLEPMARATGCWRGWCGCTLP